ncbi:uncharacterized protein DNG_03962 [Cephalotrichum gorgonifer]|uniref:Peptidase S8/S53 domain-containing protein n=1 Tax=Cephalotrichum gorgonifer TaxID=2041049 RepID=A0AAE8SU25_9PEZI|nr:uncharacterized protein DNG_03962 [Cephalotrichum gorgonifer]
MSWGFSESHPVLESAILSAAEQNIIMFVAASNDGANRGKGDRIPFPARLPQVICINASDGYGNPSRFNPPPNEDDFNFMTLGEAIQTSDPDKDSHKSLGSKQTGTSFAAPGAAAIAALLIEFAKQDPLRKDKALLREVTTMEGVIKLFAGMSEDPVLGYRYLRPWDLVWCEERSDRHDCRSCRMAAEKNVRKLLAGRVPIPNLALVPNLPHSPEAEFDSLMNEAKGMCIEGTREKALHDIMSWIEDPNGELVGWIVGRAGVGKSAIAGTICSRLYANNRLGGTYFFSLNYRKADEAFLFVTSIAYQLARYIPGFAREISSVLKEDPDLALPKKGLLSQWEKLVIKPIQSSNLKLVFVIDALDECAKASPILPLLKKLEGSGLREKLRVLVSSKPSTLVDSGFRVLTQAPRRFDLDSVSAPTVEADISKMIRHDLGMTKERLEGFSSTDFINEETVGRLAKKSSGVFLWAKVACRYIDGGEDIGNLSTLPEERLEIVLDDWKCEGLSALYLEIMENAVKGPDRDILVRQVRHVLEVIIALFVPLPLNDLTAFCPDLKSQLVKHRLYGLRSVLIVPAAPEEPVEVFHGSFRSFLIEEKHDDFGISPGIAHRHMFRRSFNALTATGDSPLHRDVCNFRDPAINADEILDFSS